MSVFGSGGIVFAGRHISYGLLAVLLSVPVAGLAIYQFRSGAIGGGVSSGSGSPSVDANGNLLDANGQPIGPTVGAVGGGGGGGGGASDAALQNLGQQVSALAQLFGSTQPFAGGAPPFAASAYGPQPAINYVGNGSYAGTKTADIAPSSGASASYQAPSPSPSPAPSYSGQVGTVQAFAPAAPYIGRLLPGILTPAAPAPTPAPAYTVTPVGSGPGGHGLITL